MTKDGLYIRDKFEKFFDCSFSAANNLYLRKVKEIAAYCYYINGFSKIDISYFFRNDSETSAFYHINKIKKCLDVGDKMLDEYNMLSNYALYGDDTFAGLCEKRINDGTLMGALLLDLDYRKKHKNHDKPKAAKAQKEVTNP